MRWIFPAADAEAVSGLARELNVPPLVARLLALRGITNPAEAARFLQPRLDHLHDPWLMRDMDRAVPRLLQAIDRKERILIYGDYDVDGAMAAIVLRTAITSLGGTVQVHIPHRVTDGYGMRQYTLEQAAREGCSVVISVDTGIREHEVIGHARELGLDCIVTDHHLPAEDLPKAFAILNPRRADCCYPEKELTGAGVAFKFVQAMFGTKLPEHGVRSYLKLVALGTIADVAPLTGENRTIVHYGLDGLSRVAPPGPTTAPGRAGLAALIAVSRLAGRPISSADVAFRLAPRLNAAGRMESANDVIELFTKPFAPAERQALARRLEEMNQCRKREQDNILAEIKRQMEDQPERASRLSLVFCGEGWHRGVIGIVAQRVVELYRRPALVIALENGVAHGSGRSVPGFHLLDALARSRDLFSRFGGHAQAAGFSMKMENVPMLETELEQHAAATLTPQHLEPTLCVHARASLAEFSDQLSYQINRLEPFGSGNPEPVFASHVTIAGKPRIFKDKHLNMWVQDRGRWIETVGWELGTCAAQLARGQTVEVAFTLAKTCFQGETNLQLILKDIRC